MAYLEEPENEVEVVSFDMPIYNPDTDSLCKTPKILGFCVEDSEVLLVGNEFLSDGVQVVLNTGEVGIISEGLAVIDLNLPLVFGAEVWVEIDNETCKARSCSVYVSRIASVCLVDSSEQEAGSLTGRFRANGKDMYAEVYDGDGGVDLGPIIQPDCIYFGGNLPNCIEPPIETTTYYNIVSCANGQVYQTDTVLAVASQRVNHPIHGLHYWNNTTVETNSPSAYRGEVTILAGLTLCPSEPVITYYDIVSCADSQVYQTQTILTINNERVSHGTFGEHYWNGNTRTTTLNDRGFVNRLSGLFGCS